MRTALQVIFGNNFAGVAFARRSVDSLFHDGVCATAEGLARPILCYINAGSGGRGILLGGAPLSPWSVARKGRYWEAEMMYGIGWGSEASLQL